MRLLVCGGREYGHIDARFPALHHRRRAERARLADFLDRLVAERGPVEAVIHGAARGADAAAGRWAADRGHPVLAFPAEWDDVDRPGATLRRRRSDGKLYDADAGKRRNQKMIDDGKPDLVVAFPGNFGTADMIARARAAGIEVMEASEKR